MNKIRGTYWPSGARFLSVVSYLKKIKKVPSEGGHVTEGFLIHCTFCYETQLK